MKLLKSTDKNLFAKMDKLAENNQSFKVLDIDSNTIHIFEIKK